MIVFPNAKINLGLKVLYKREDGFHQISSVMVPVELADILEIQILPKSNRSVIGSLGALPLVFSDKEINFYLTGIPVIGEPDTNLCVRAAKAFRKKFPFEGVVRMHLHKVIPTGAGLGGGSSDAAFVLQSLNLLTGQKAPVTELELIAAGLGSDCPFFIRNKPSNVTGRGELLETIRLPLKGYSLLIAKPPVSVSTAEAYSMVKPSKQGKYPEQLVHNAISTWQNELLNDFEQGMCESFPEIGSLINSLKSAGGIYVSMSGSGSAVYGIFKGEIPEISFPENTFKWNGVLKQESI